MAEVARRLNEAAPEGGALTDFVLLEGRSPTPPREAEIVWSDEYFKTGFEVDPKTGAMDYRRRAGRRSVAAGEHLATFIPPEPGEDGRDLLGKTVPALRPKVFRVRAGANVRFDEAAGKYYATKDGRIRFTGNVLSVDDVYTIPGSVDLRTGHIKHPGALVVAKNIESESRVEALGDIDVNGTVENAEVVTKGSLTVHGGITGGPRCKIRAEGNIQAKFILNAEIEAGGNVVSEHEINQCTIMSRGAVMVTHGRIVGGDVIALAGIETDQIGSEAFVRTNLAAGEDYTLKEFVAAKENEIQKRRDALHKISERLLPLKERGKTLPPKLREMATQLLSEATKVTEAIRQIEEELENVRADSRSRAKKEVLVRKAIFPDAFFHIPPLTLLIKDKVDGPVKVVIRENDILLIGTHAP